MELCVKRSLPDRVKQLDLSNRCQIFWHWNRIILLLLMGSGVLCWHLANSCGEGDSQGVWR